MTRVANLRSFRYVLVLLLLLAGMLGAPRMSSAAPAWTNAWKTVGTWGSDSRVPRSLAVGPDGTVYVTTGSGIDRLPVDAVAPSGYGQPVTLTTTTGLSSHPDSIAVDPNGNLYTSDSNSSVVQELPSGTDTWGTIGGVTAAQVYVPGKWVEVEYTLAGVPYTKMEWSPGFWTNGTTNVGTIYVPLGVAVDDNGVVYVTNQGAYDSMTYYHSCEKLENGTWTVIGNQYYNSLYYIEDVATDSAGNVYVTTQYSSATRQGRDAIFKYSGGSWSQIGNTGSGTNMPVMPAGIAVDKWGSVYVTSWGDHTVKVLSNGQWKTVGGYGIGGPSSPTDVAVDGSGNVFVTDSTNKTLMELQAPATQLVWQVQPGNGTAGQTWGQPPVVALVDGNGNVETEDSTHTVTLTLNNANGATLSNTTVQLHDGLATFSSLAVSNVGSGFTLTPSCSLSPGLTAQASNSFSMAAPPGPSIQNVSPATGVGGTKVTITGTNLTAASLVEFGDTAGVNLVVESDTRITVTAPTHAAGVVDVRVTTPGGKSPVNSPADQFTFNPPGAFAGSWTIIGDSGNGGFGDAAGIDVDSSGNVYVADNRNNKVKKLSGGTWSDVALTVTAPNDVDVDINGVVYVADNTRVYRNGTVIADCTAFDPLFYGKSPLGLAADKQGNLYAGLNGEVLKWNSGTWSWTNISYDGSFSLPWGIAVDDSGSVYAADSMTNAVKKLAPGATAWETIGSGFNSPYDVVVDSLGNIYVADCNNHVVRERQVGMTDWVSVGISFRYPTGIAVDSSGNLYVTGSNSSGGSLVEYHQAPATQLVWRVQPAGSSVGKDLPPYPSLELKDAYGNVVTSDSSDTVTVSLYSNNGAKLTGTASATMVNGVADFVDLKIDRAGTGYVLVPSCTLPGIVLPNSDAFSVSEASTPPARMSWLGGWTDIGGSSGFSNAYAVAVDDSLHVYVVDQSTPFIGPSQWGSVKNWIGDGNWYNVGTPALKSPSGIAVKSGAGGTSVYVADTANYRVTYNGSTLGGGFYSPAWSYFMPDGVAVDQNGNVYAVGNAAGTYVLKWNGSTWSNITYHGNFSNPVGVTVDGSGNLFVADKGKREVYMMPAGTTQWKTIGTGFTEPNSIAVDGWGNIYITDGNNGGVVKALQAGRTDWVALPMGGTWGVTGVGVDKNGNIYVAFHSYVYTRPAPATQLVWQAQPGGGTAGVPWTQQPVLCLKDANGNTVTGGSGSKVTVTLTDPSSGATLSGTTQASLVNGVATFAGLKVDRAGSYRLKATFESLASVDSSSFDITVGPAAQLVWGIQPSGGESGKPWIRQPVLYLADAGGNVLTGDNSSKVTVALTTANGAVLAGTLEQTLQDGTATFGTSSIDKLSIDKAGDYRLTATCGGIASQSSTFTITPGVAAQLVWHLQPGGGTGGTKWVQQPALYLEDASGNILTNDSTSEVTVALTATNGATFSKDADTTVTLVNGVAAFGNLAIDKIGTGYTLTATCSLSGTSTTITSSASNAFDVVLGPAAKLVWQAQPVGGESGKTWSQPPVLCVTDAGSNLVASDTGTTVTVALDADGGTVSGTQATTQSGIVTFSDLTISKAGRYTLTATCSVSGTTITSPPSDSFDIAPGNAAKLAWITEPGGGTGGAAWAQQPVLCLADANGNVKIDDSTSTVTVTLTGGSGATLGGTTQVTLKNGVATFAGLSVDKIGTYTLTASCGLNGVSASESSTFAISVGPAARLIWQTQPVGSNADSNLATQPVLYLADAGGNVEAADNTSKVTISLTDLGGATLSGTNQVTVQSGVATFTDLHVDQAGTYTLTATHTTSGGATIASAPSGPFAITPGAATQLVWQTQPGGAESGSALNPQPSVALADKYGNVGAGGSGSEVTVALTDATGNPVLSSVASLSGGATVELQNGAAVFSGLNINKVGTYFLTASCGVMTSPVSSGFTITFGAANIGQSTISVSKPSVVADGSDYSTITVTLKDVNGNPVIGKDVTLSHASLKSVVTAEQGTSGSDGVARFTVTNTKAELVSYTATVDHSAVTGPVDVTFVPGSVEKLGVTASAAQTAGASFSVTVTAQDHYGNTVPGYSGKIQFSTNDGTSPKGDEPLLPGDYTFTVTDKGSHTFDGVKLYRAAASSTLTATDAAVGTIKGTSGDITVNAGQVNADNSGVTASPSSVTADDIDASLISVTLKDAYKNPIAGKSVTLEANGGSSTIAAVNATSDADGTASFSVRNKTAEEVEYTATAGVVAMKVKVAFVPGALNGLDVSTVGTRTAGVPFSVTVTARDANGNVITGYAGEVTFSAGNAGASPDGTSPTLPGLYEFTPQDAGTHAFSVTLCDATLHNGTPFILIVTGTVDGKATTTTKNITVYPGHVNTDNSELRVSKPSVVANNSDSATITATLRDTYGNLIGNKAVTLSRTSGGSSTVSPTSVDSSADGTAAFTVTSTKAETVTFKATADGTDLADTVEIVFIAGAEDAARSTVAGSKPFVAADGTDSATIIVTLKDAYGNPVSGKIVRLDQSVAQGSGSSVIDPATSTSDANGVATFAVTDSVLEPVTYEAKTDVVTVSQNVTVNFAQPRSVSVSANPAAGGTVSGGGTFGEGATVIVVATPNGNYSFDGWTEAGDPAIVSSGTSLVFQLGAADRALIANFSLKTHSLTIAAGGGGNITTGNSGDYAPGSVINIAARPSSGYSFDRWTSLTGGSFGNATSASTTFTMPANAVTITATFKRDEESDTTAPNTPTYEAGVKSGAGEGHSLTVSVDTNTGTAAVNLGSQAQDVFTANGTTVISIPPIEGTDSYTLDVPASTLSDSEGVGQVTLSTSVGSVTIPAGMLSGTGGAEGVTGSEAGITIAEGDKSSLPSEVKQALGDRPLVHLTLTLDGHQAEWNNPDAPVTVSIPYTLTAEELLSPEHITVWYIDGSGNVVSVPSGRFVPDPRNPATGTVTFTATHFSAYAVAFVQRTFGDLSSVEWAREPIEVLASKGVIQGTSSTTYSPQANITRADFVALLVRTLGLTAKPGPNFDDVQPGAYYYDAVGVAKAMGIVTGSGNNLFRPHENITRQDMMVMTARALSRLKGLGSSGDSSALAGFMDKGDIATYASGPLAALVEKGLVAGSGGKMNPCGLTTRAEAAVFLYRVYHY